MMPGFNYPYLLLFLLLIFLFKYIYKKILAKKEKQAILFSNLSTIKSLVRDKGKLDRDKTFFNLSLFIYALMIIGFSNPHIPLGEEAEGINLVLILDISESMTAEDYSPSRLESAKASAEKFIDKLKPKDQVGIITFSSGARVAAHLSPNKENVKEYLSIIRPREANTAIGDGLYSGIQMANSLPDKESLIILLSDGKNNAGIITPQDAITYAIDSDIKVNTIAIGSEEKVILNYYKGQPIYAELDEELLKEIALKTGGQPYKSTNSLDLDEIYNHINQDLEYTQKETNIGFLFFLVAFVILIYQSYRRYGKGRIIQ